MLTKKYIALLAGSALAFHAGSASAATIVSYDFTGGSASQTGGIATGSDTTVGGFTSGNNGGTGISGSSEVLFARTNSTGASTADGDSLADAIANDTYWTFTVTNTTGGDLDLGTLTFNYWATSGFGTFTTYVMSDVDGFTDGDEIGSGSIDAPAVNSAALQELQTIDISSLGTLADTDSIEFRLYIVDASTANNRIHRIDDVTVNEVPEPGSLALLAIGGLCMVRRRR